MTVQKLYTEEDIITILQAEKGKGRTLRDIAGDYPGSTYGDIQRGLKGVFPKTYPKRAVFRLVSFVPVQPCPIHGVVHTKRCPSRRRPPTRWEQWSIPALRWAIEHRVEMP